jgi:hypothetical protein
VTSVALKGKVMLASSLLQPDVLSTVCTHALQFVDSAYVSRELKLVFEQVLTVARWLAGTVNRTQLPRWATLQKLGMSKDIELPVSNVVPSRVEPQLRTDVGAVHPALHTAAI